MDIIQQIASTVIVDIYNGDSSEPETFVVDWPQNYTLRQFLEQEDIKDFLPDEPQNLIIQQKLDTFVTGAIKQNLYQKDALVDQDNIELVIHQKVNDYEIQKLIHSNEIETQEVITDDDIITDTTQTISQSPKFQSTSFKNTKKFLQLDLDQDTQSEQQSRKQHTDSQVASTPRIAQSDVKTRFTAKLSTLEKALSTMQSSASGYNSSVLIYEEKTYKNDYKNVVPFVDKSEPEETDLIQQLLEDSCAEFKYHVVEVVSVTALQQIDNLYCVRQSLGFLPDQEQLVDDCYNQYQIAIVRNAYGAYVIIYFEYDKKFNIEIKAIYPICSRAMIQLVDENNVPPQYRVLPITQSDAEIESSRADLSDIQTDLYNQETEEEQRFILTVDGYSQMLQLNNGQASRLSHALQIAVSELTGQQDYQKQIEAKMLSIHFFLKLCKVFNIDINDICQIAQSTINEEYPNYIDLYEEDIEKWYQSLLSFHYSIMCMDFYQDNFDCIVRKLKKVEDSNFEKVYLQLEQFVICPMIINQAENIINLTNFDKYIDNLAQDADAPLNPDNMAQLVQLQQVMHALQKVQQLLKSGDRQTKPLPIELLYSDLSGEQNQNFASRGQFDIILLDNNEISKKTICDSNSIQNTIFSQQFSNFLLILPDIINNKLNTDQLPQFFKNVYKEVRNLCSENEIKLQKVFPQILNVDQNLMNYGINPGASYAIVCIGQNPTGWKEKLQKYKRVDALEEFLTQVNFQWNETQDLDYKQKQANYQYYLSLVKCDQGSISIAVNKNTLLPPLVSFDKQLKVYQYNDLYKDIEIFQNIHRYVIQVDQNQFLVKLDDTFDIQQLKDIGLIYCPIEQIILKQAILDGKTDVIQNYINSLQYLNIVDVEEQDDADERMPEFNQINEFGPEFSDARDKLMEFLLSLNWYQMILQQAWDSKKFYLSSIISYSFSLPQQNKVQSEQQEETINDYIKFYTEQYVDKQNEYINYQGTIECPELETIEINTPMFPEDATQTLFKVEDEFDKLKKKQLRIAAEIQQSKFEKKIIQQQKKLQEVEQFVIEIIEKVCQKEIEKKSKIDKCKKKYNQKIEQNKQMLNYWLQHQTEDDIIQLKNSKGVNQTSKISTAINKVINHSQIAIEMNRQLGKAIDYFEVQDIIGGFDFEDSQATYGKQHNQQYMNQNIDQQQNTNWWTGVL